jgi:hypothetical protein
VLVADQAAMSTVAVVEDHGPLRVFLRDALTSTGWTVTGIAGSVDTGEDLLLGTARSRIVVFTASADPAELRAVVKAGVDGIVLKEGGLPELASGLAAVAAGARFLSPSLPAGVWHELSALQPV